MEEIKVHFFGNVHGVGFRATTLRLAQQLQLKGYVRNNPDGSVEVVAQGASAELKDLIHRLKEIFPQKYISEVVVEFRKPITIYPDFTIKK